MKDLSNSLKGQVLLLPMVFVLGVSAVYPLLQALAFSLYDWRWGREATFVGLANFISLLQTPKIWQVFGRTTVFSISTVTIEMAIGLAVAIGVDKLTRGQGILRTVLILPLMVSGIATSLVWKVMLDPALGIVNFGLTGIGISSPPAWLGSSSTALGSLVLIDVWWQTGFSFIVLSAAIKGLPGELFEAAKIDGAGPVDTFRFVTLPQLVPIITMIAVFRIIDTMKVFDIVFGTTGGGPGQSTEVIQTLAYRTAFKFLELGESAAIMVVFSLLIVGLAALHFRYNDTTTGSGS